jgi:hemerythrin-like domain-containing protein
MSKSEKIDRNAKPKPEDMKSELSPMDPPEAFKPPSIEEVPVSEMHPFLQEFISDHTSIKAALEQFEETIILMKENGITRELNGKLADFFELFNDEFIAHDRKEEKSLFPVLGQKLIERGEHSQGPIMTTAIDVMEDDHLKVLQLTAVIFNFFGLASRLKDDTSRCMVMDAALEQSNQLIELLRLHIFREDTILFPLAHKHIERDELDRLQRIGRKSAKN